MEITVYKYPRNDSPVKREYYKITSYEPVATLPNLLLVSDGKMEYEDQTTHGYFEIRKIQFLANCKTEFLDRRLLIAFYLGDYNELCHYILSPLGDGYVQDGDTMMLVDYKSYLEICEYTRESPLSFNDYFQELRSGSLGCNTLLDDNGTLLNYDGQKSLFIKQDQAKKMA
jgi:hypothetical protein